MLMRELINQIQAMKGKKNLIICHDHADSDAIGSAYALSRFIGADVGVPKFVAFHTQALVEELEIGLLLQPDPSVYEHVIIVDTANPIQLPGIQLEDFYLFDHHPGSELVKAATGSLYEEVSSTAQLMYRFLVAAGATIDRKMALGLAAGILTDTVHFHRGDAEAFATFGALLEIGALSYEDVQKPFMVSDRYDREAIMDAALHAKKANCGGYHVLITQVDKNIPTFAARALFDLGADISVVGHQRGEEVEIRMYVRREMMESTGKGASDLLRAVEGISTEQVWGYALFAGYRNEGKVTPLLDAILLTFQNVLK